MTELDQVRKELEYARQTAQSLPAWKQEAIALAWQAERRTADLNLARASSEPSAER